MPTPWTRTCPLCRGGSAATGDHDHGAPGRPADRALLRVVRVPLADLGLTLLLVVPPIARFASCTSDSPPCTAWGFRAVPWWWPLLWSLSLLVAIVVCRPPRRWWTPQDRAGRPRQPGVFSTPEWLRGHALVAALATLGPMLNYEPTAADRIGYAASIAVALIGACVATAVIRRTADIIPKALHRGIAQGYDIWLLPSERRLRARYGGPRVPAARSTAARAERARVGTRSALVYTAWCFAVLCAVPVAVATAVLLVVRPEPEPGPYTLLFALAWVPWVLTAALLVIFVAGIGHSLPGRRGGVRAAMLGLVALCGAAAVWYLLVGTPYYGGFTWGFGVLLAVQGLLAVAIIGRMLVPPRLRATQGSQR